MKSDIAYDYWKSFLQRNEERFPTFGDRQPRLLDYICLNDFEMFYDTRMEELNEIEYSHNRHFGMDVFEIQYEAAVSAGEMVLDLATNLMKSDLPYHLLGMDLGYNYSRYIADNTEGRVAQIWEDGVLWVLFEQVEEAVAVKVACG